MIVSLIEKLRQRHTLNVDEYKALLLSQDAEALKYLQEQAQEVTIEVFGNQVFIRGLIEITNRCRNNCYYCGIRKGNQAVVRYELTQEEILACCRKGYALGFRTFVLQGGETPDVKDDRIVGIVSAIRRIAPSLCRLAKNPVKPMNVSFKQAPTGIYYGTKPITKNIIAGCTLPACHYASAFNVWNG